MVLNTIGLTGASGMLGRHILKLLHESDIVCRSSSRTRPAFLRDNDTWYSLDLAEWYELKELDRAFSGVQALIHAGACLPGVEQTGRNEAYLLRVNVQGTLLLCEWARLRDVVLLFISSGAVYENCNHARLYEDSPRTNGDGLGGIYAYSKVVAEDLIALQVSRGLRAVILRPSSIYGSGLPNNKFIPQLLSRAMNGENLIISPPSGQKINFIHAHDVARACLLAIEQDAKGVFNIPGLTHSVQELAETCVDVVGKSHVITEEGVNEADGIRFDLDGQFAKAHLGYTPIVSLKEGLNMMIQTL